MTILFLPFIVTPLHIYYHHPANASDILKNCRAICPTIPAFIYIFHFIPVQTLIIRI